jgi:hypothetical protein
MKNLLLNEVMQDGSHHAMLDGFQTDFIENLNNPGFVVMATHGTPTIVRVPRADTSTMKNMPTWEGP